MNSIKKLLLVIISGGAFFVAAYNLVWAPDWQIKRWPEVQLRAAYIQAIAEAAMNPFGNTDAETRIKMIMARAPEIEEEVFSRLLFSLSIAAGVTIALALVPGISVGGKERRLRGAMLASPAILRKRIAWRRNTKILLIAGSYVVAGAAVGAYFDSLRDAFFAALLGLFLYFFAEFASTGRLWSRPGVHIGGVQVPEEMEGRHFLIAGTTGAGKSLAIYQMIGDARRRGDRGLILDIGSACTTRFFGKGDLQLAPGVPEAVKWNPFLEIRNRFDFLELARSAIPDSAGDAQDFRDMARVLLSTVMETMYKDGNFSVARLLYIVCSAKKEELNKIVVGTPADVYTQDGGERLLQNVRSVLTTYLVAWHFLEDNGKFSVRDWIRNAPAGQWLFVRYSDGQATVMRQLLACWLKLAITETIDDDKNPPPPTWFVADEFDSLGAVSAARDALSKLRRYNGRCVFGVQTVAQLWTTYGPDGATVLLSCLSHQLFLRAGDPDTAEYCSKGLGDQEVLRHEQSHSSRGLGGDPSKTEAVRHATERIVMPSEFTNLPDRVGYLNLAGDLPVAKVKIPIPESERAAR